MAQQSLIFNLYFLLTSVVILGADGAKIQFFKRQNFTGSVWEIHLTEGCVNVPQDQLGVFNSIKTDSCFIAYIHPDCKSLRSEKFLPGDISLSSNQVGVEQWIRSLQICNDEEGGNQLHVDVTKFLGSSNLSPEVIQSYKNVCSCVNIPQQNLSAWSIDNHHNSLLAYYEPDCSENKWNSQFIAAGQYLSSIYMLNFEKTDHLTKKVYKIQSLGPDPNSSYFQIGCNPSQVTTEEKEAKGSTTGHKDELSKLTDSIKQLQQQFQNFSAQLKFGRFELFARLQ